MSPRMLTFKYSTLPAELKNNILSQVDIDVSLKLTKADKYSRSYALKNGPFPARIDRVELFCDEDWRGDEEDRFYAVIYTKARSFQLSIGDSIEFGDFEGSIENPELRFAFWGLVNRIYSIKSLSVRVELRESCYEHECNVEAVARALRGFITETKLFAGLNAVSKFHVETTEFEVGKAVIESFTPKIANLCQLVVGKSDEEPDREAVKNYLQAYFEKPHLQMCQQICISDRNSLDYKKFRSVRVFLHLNLVENLLKTIGEHFESEKLAAFQAFGIRGIVKTANNRPEPSIDAILAYFERIFNSTSGLKTVSDCSEDALRMEKFFQETCKKDGAFSSFDALSDGYLPLNLYFETKHQWFFEKVFEGNRSILCLTILDHRGSKPRFTELQLLVKKV